MLFYLLTTLFVIVCVLLIVVVLLQKGRGGGLGSAFGGAASSAFGTRIGDVFTWVTIVLTALFLLLAIGTFMYVRPKPDQVARPQFIPPPSVAETAGEEPFHVEMVSATLDAQIHYTTDGGEPTTDSPLYDGPVRVEPGTTLKARGYRDGGWTPSVIVEAYYGPQDEAPTPAGEDADEPAPPAEQPSADQPDEAPEQ